MKYVGVDWAHEVHVVVVSDEDGRELTRRNVHHTAPDLAEFIEWLEEVAPLDEGRTVAVETGAVLLCDVLLKAKQPIYVINPKAVDRYRDRHSPAGAKDDRRDAYVLAEIIRTDRHRHRPFQPDSELTEELRLVVRGRIRLVDKRTAASNELLDALRHHFPVAASLPAKRTDRWFLEFLQFYPDSESALAAPLEELEGILARHRVRKWNSRSLRDFLRKQHVPVRGSVQRAYGRITLDLVEQLVVLNTQIESAEREIESLLKRHPDREIALSLPGTQTTLAARMLAEISDDRSRLGDHSSLQGLAGTSPVTRRSGKGRPIVMMRRACNRHLQVATFLQAKTSRARCSWANAYYNHARAQGQSHAAAVRALANKWLKILSAMLVHRKPYDESLHLRNLRNSGVPWCPAEGV